MTYDLMAQCQRTGIRLVRFCYCDNANLIRGKAVPIENLSGALESGVGYSVAQQALPVMHDVVVEEAGLAPIGEVRLMADAATFTALPYSPGAAMVLGDFLTLDRKPWDACPRAFLKRMIAGAAEQGLEVQAAFENEFFLLREGPQGHDPADRTNFASTYAMDVAHEVVMALLDALQAEGLAVQLYHPESGPGQHEISIRHAAALAAADRQVIFRETVRGVALHHGLAASFAPKPYADAAGSGCHLHLSLWRGGRNALYDPHDPLNLSEAGYHFIGGLLSHLRGLAAVTTPSVNSYRRLRPQTWSGAFTCYGVENREAAVRVIAPFWGREEASCNLELKTSDPSANPYLALGCVIAAGMDGIARRLNPGEPVSQDPALIPEAERARRGIVPLPRNLGEAIEALGADRVLLDAMGPTLARAFTAVRRAEWEAMKDVPLEEELRHYLWRY
ncbi:MAG: glutamine synthetase [Armatimonadetes bacterium]|nr:glutamine synthetase [Armatimonadota bacterium]